MAARERFDRVASTYTDMKTAKQMKEQKLSHLSVQKTVRELTGPMMVMAALAAMPSLAVAEETSKQADNSERTVEAQGVPSFVGRPDLSSADKSKYTLFNPTPKELMRDMSTDRPDRTESAYTVDAGHIQVEMDFFNYTYDKDTSGGADTRVKAWGIAPINFKVGLLNNVDLQTVIESYNHVTTEDRVGATKVRQSGFGDITSRLKVNLWGNDGGSTALALMPFVKFPTNQDKLGNNSVEGGLIVPLAIELPAGFGMGVMTEFDFIRDEDGDGHHVEFVNSITVSRDIIGDLGGYVELWSGVSTEEDSDWVGTFDLGLTYGLTDDIQLDAGANIGITRSAETIQPFVGMSFRF